jgi:hypothetical protein
MIFSAVDSVIYVPTLAELFLLPTYNVRNLGVGESDSAGNMRQEHHMKWVLPKTRTLMYRIQDYAWSGCELWGKNNLYLVAVRVYRRFERV